MLKGKDFLREYWSEALNAAIHICNRTETVAVEGKTPYQAYYGKKPIISYLRIFGSNAYVYVHKDTCTKLDSHSRKGISIGYSKESKVYKVYDLVKKQVLICRDVPFGESDSQAAERI